MDILRMEVKTAASWVSVCEPPPTLKGKINLSSWSGKDVLVDL